MCSAEAVRVKPSQLLDFAAHWMIREETFRSFFVKSQMQSTQLELDFGSAPSPSFGKTCPACSTQKTTHSGASWPDLVAQTLPCRPAQIDGRVRVLLPAWRETSRGGCSMLNISECPNAVVASTLSQVLQRGVLIPQRYFLSRRACAGILRRAETRGKVLPALLKAALERSVNVAPPQP